MLIDTKTAQRRDIRYQEFADISEDMDRIEAAHRAGTMTTTGNWSAGQVFDHIAILMECAIDGFPTKAPAPIRWVSILFFKKKALSGSTLPAGFKLPAGASFLIPADSVTFDSGLARLRKVLSRVEAGEQFTQPSPILGRMTQDEWIRLQCSHAALHMSFIRVQAPGDEQHPPDGH